MYTNSYIGTSSIVAETLQTTGRVHSYSLNKEGIIIVLSDIIDDPHNTSEIRKKESKKNNVHQNFDFIK
jgi:hypothetical protein